MAVTVYIPTPFRRATGNRDRVEVRAKDVRAMLDELETAHPRLKRLADEGFAFAVIYHSHPNAGAYFSETDRGQALIKGEPAYPGAVYVVVSVVGREVKALAAYRWNAERRVFERADAGDLDPAEPAVSRRLLAAAERRIPGGVNSPVRAFRSVGGEP